MCNVEEPVMLKEKSPLACSPIGNLCIKCKAAKGSIAVRQTIYCKSCFESAFLLKFRTFCAKNRSSPQDSEHILLCFSGGLSSRALIWAALEPTLTDPLRKNSNNFTILYVDEGRFPPGEIEAFLKEKIGVKRYLARKLVEPSDVSVVDSVDAKGDFLWHCKSKMFFQVAQELGCTKIYTGENATKTAIKIIEYTAKGRGYSLPFDVRKNDSYRESLGITLIRPLSEHTAKEIGYFCQVKGLVSPATPIPKSHSFHDAGLSIAGLTEQFILGLERDYPSTVSTVSKTATKFTTPIIKASKNCGAAATKRCKVCDCLIAPEITQWFLNTTILNASTSSEECSFQKHSPDLCYACCMIVVS